jgi:hypothetical protein
MFVTVKIVVLYVTPCGLVAVYRIGVVKGVARYAVTNLK